MKIEWIVGFWEGEGSIYTYQRVYRKRRDYLAVSFTQSGASGRRLLVKIKSFLGGVGGEIHGEKSRKPRNRTRQSYTYTVNGVEAAVVMKKFLPLLESEYRVRQVKRCLRKYFKSFPASAPVQR